MILLPRSNLPVILEPVNGKSGSFSTLASGCSVNVKLEHIQTLPCFDYSLKVSSFISS